MFIPTFLMPVIFSSLIILYYLMRTITADTQISIFQKFFEAWAALIIPLVAGLVSGLLGDLTIGCGDWTEQQGLGIEFNGWLDFIRKVISKYGSHLTSLQITNEPNLSFMEGSKFYILQALVEGVITAKKEVQEYNLPVRIGFGSVPESPASVPQFWDNLAKAGGNNFIESVDFVGHNFYVDVFEDEPLDLKEIPVSVERTLRNLREKDLATAGIPTSVPIRVTENGWPTGKNPIANIERSYERQAEVLETVIRTVYDLRQELNISHYELFGLRDADSSKDDLFHQYGIMRDDYSSKPAYDTFKRLIQELVFEQGCLVLTYISKGFII